MKKLIYVCAILFTISSLDASVNRYLNLNKIEETQALLLSIETAGGPLDLNLEDQRTLHAIHSPLVEAIADGSNPQFIHTSLEKVRKLGKAPVETMKKMFLTYVLRIPTSELLKSSIYSEYAKNSVWVSQASSIAQQLGGVDSFIAHYPETFPIIQRANRRGVLPEVEVAAIAIQNPEKYAVGNKEIFALASKLKLNELEPLLLVAAFSNEQAPTIGYNSPLEKMITAYNTVASIPLVSHENEYETLSQIESSLQFRTGFKREEDFNRYVKFQNLMHNEGLFPFIRADGSYGGITSDEALNIFSKLPRVHPMTPMQFRDKIQLIDLDTRCFERTYIAISRCSQRALSLIANSSNPANHLRTLQKWISLSSNPDVCVMIAAMIASDPKAFGIPKNLYLHK